MSRPLFALLLFVTMAAAADDDANAEPALRNGTQLTYRGSIDRERSEVGTTTRKTFELTLLIARRDKQQTTLYWHLKQKGHGDWPWTGRFGRIDVGVDWRAGSAGPALLYDRDEGKSVVPLRLPMLRVPASAAKAARWKSAAVELEIVAAEQARFDEKQLARLKVELPKAQRNVAGIKLLEPLAAEAVADLKQQSLRVTSIFYGRSARRPE